jgi:O-antigen/teichoic acid export membrane protein
MTGKILKSTLVGLVAKCVGMLGVIILTPLMLQRLGHSGYGIWMTISSATALLGFMDLGIGNNLMGLIAINIEKREVIRRLITQSYLAQLLLVSVLLVVMIAVYHLTNWLALFKLEHASPDVRQTFVVMFSFFLVSLVSNTVYIIQRGLQRSDLANAWQLLSNIASIIFLYIVLRRSNSMILVAFGTFGVPVCLGLLNTIWFLTKKRLLYLDLSVIRLGEIFRLLRGGMIILYLQVVAMLAFQTDTLILAHYMTYEDVSRFSILVKLFSVPAIITGIYFQTLWPAYTHALGQGNWKWIKRTFYYSLFLSCGLILIYCLGVYWGKDVVFKYWLKTDWVFPLELFVLFGLWTLVSNIDSNIGIILNGLRQFRIQVVLASVMMAANLVLSVLLVQRQGMSGVIWGTVLSTIVFSLIPFMIYLNRLLRQKQAEALK